MVCDVAGASEYQLASRSVRYCQANGAPVLDHAEELRQWLRERQLGDRGQAVAAPDQSTIGAPVIRATTSPDRSSRTTAFIAVTCATVGGPPSAPTGTTSMSDPVGASQLKPSTFLAITWRERSRPRLHQVLVAPPSRRYSEPSERSARAVVDGLTPRPPGTRRRRADAAVRYGLLEFGRGERTRPDKPGIPLHRASRLVTKRRGS